MAKISEIEPIVLYDQEADARWASYSILVKVVTSDGRASYGEAVPTLRVLPVVSAVRQAAKAFVGRDPHEIYAGFYEWYRQDFFLSRSFESATALSAIDMALWDLKARELGAPLHELLGGAIRRRVPVYANGWYGGCRDAGCFAERAREVVGRGYTALKFDPFRDSFDVLDGASLRRAVEAVAAVREAVGDGVDILIECHGRFNAESAVRAAEALRPYGIYFMEEPVHPEDLEGLARFRSAARVPVALGERVVNKGQLLQYIRYADYIQVDLGRFGGPTEARKAAAIAEAFGVLTAFHNANGPVLHAATLQLDAAIPNFAVQESFYDFWPRWKRELIRDTLPVEGGHVEVPSRPGIGVDVDEKAVERYRAEGEVEPPREPSWAVRGTW